MTERPTAPPTRPPGEPKPLIDEDIAPVLARLDAWFAAHLPPDQEPLNPPATEAQLVEFERRRRGVGSALMRWVEHYAAAREIGRIVLDHWAANETAQAFFARCGFSPVKMVVRKDVAQG